jgi:KipI family sensor histidine kinase inhibitor
MMPGFEVLGVGDRAAMSLPKDRWLGDNDSGPLHGDGPDYKLLDAGDTALVVEFGDSIDRRISATVLALARRVSQIDLDGVVECVPTFRSLMVHYDPLVVTSASLGMRIGELIRGLHVRQDAGRVWQLPACYDPCIAPDLEHVADRTGLSAAQVVECHSATSYHVYMLGFLPGMAYLGDVLPELVLPRLATPRLKVPAGSLGIATTMTCVYPMDTPAGWHLIGRCPVPFLERRPQPTVLLAAGDKVTFTPVSLGEYEQLSAQAAAGTLKILPVDEPMEVAA